MRAGSGHNHGLVSGRDSTRTGWARRFTRVVVGPGCREFRAHPDQPFVPWPAPGQQRLEARRRGRRALAKTGAAITGSRWACGITRPG